MLDKLSQKFAEYKYKQPYLIKCGFPFDCFINNLFYQTNYIY